jgi:hypothetical protein
MELATELCADAASKRMEVCEVDADDEIAGAYGPVICEATGIEPPMTGPTVDILMLRVW